MRRDSPTETSDHRFSLREEQQDLHRRLGELEIDQQRSLETLQPVTYHSRNKSQAESLRLHTASIDEEAEENIVDDGYEHSDSYSPAPLAFEIVAPRSHRRHFRHSKPESNVSDMKRIRVKIHADDTRYVMILPTTNFADFVDQIRNKFGLVNDFKVKMMDEEKDLVTMSDQDDLDMCVEAARLVAKKEQAEMGKMDVSLF